MGGGGEGITEARCSKNENTSGFRAWGMVLIKALYGDV